MVHKSRLSLGSELATHLEAASRRSHRLHLNSQDAPPRRLWYFKAFLGIFLIVALARLVDVQIINGSYYHELANSNRLRQARIRAPRGLIFDADGQPLVENIPVYRLIPSDCHQDACTKSLTREEALERQSQSDSRLTFDVGRKYLLGPASAHLLGYLGEINSQELTSASLENTCRHPGKYQLGDLVGRLGLEAEYECSLQGEAGTRLVEIDTTGKEVRDLGQNPPRPGQNLRLTIKSHLQQAAHEALRSQTKAALIISRPSTGEVLALASFPTFDPNQLLSGSPEKINSILSQSNFPFFNRAIAGTYPPGSTFKLITATAALENHAISPGFTFIDPGFIKVNTYSYSNWYFSQYGRTEGEINLSRALARSTDTFFYTLGEKLGPEPLASWARDFNLGKTTGIDLPGEIAGLVPDPDWKQQVKGERWFLGNTYHISIGQGDLLTTPLQINQATAAIAASGNWCQPYLNQALSPNCHHLYIDPQTLDQIKQGMVGACSPGGTAFPLFNFPVPVACKTGTAETPDPEVTHAWLTAFAPVDHPEVAITVLVEGGGEGSRVAAPIVKQVLIDYFNLTEDELKTATAPASPKPGEAE